MNQPMLQGITGSDCPWAEPMASARLPTVGAIVGHQKPKGYLRQNRITDQVDQLTERDLVLGIKLLNFEYCPQRLHHYA
jgi:hypothetical protein